MLKNLLNNKFNKQTTLILEWSVYCKLILIFAVIPICQKLHAQKHLEFYFGSHINKIQTTTENLNISNKANSLATISPLLGINCLLNKTCLSFETKFFKTNFTNEFTYKDIIQNNTVITGFNARFIQFSIVAKQNIITNKKSRLNLNTLFNVVFSNTPFDELTSISAQNTYILYSHHKTNLGSFYNLSIALEYNYKINNKYGLFVCSQINSNFNRTLVEENNTIAYPDQTMAYQFLKINGKSASINIGLTYNLTKKRNHSTIK